MKFNYDYDEIVRLVTSHESFSVRPDCVLGGLPKFYGLEQYGAGKEAEATRWKEEIRRLVSAVNSGRPHSIQGNEKLFGKADPAGYARLDQLIMQIQHAWMISDLDNELIALDHAPDLASTRKIFLIERNLRREYHIDDAKVRYKRPINLSSDDRVCFHSLVDHLTANLAQMLARLASGKFWEENCIAALAKFSAKLKWLVLVHGLPRSVSASVSSKATVFDQLKAEGRFPLAPVNIESKEMGRKNYEAKEPDEAESRKEPNMNGKGNRYFVVQMAFYELVSHLIETSLDQLTSNDETGTASDVFETSVIIYDTCYFGRRAMVCGLRDGGIGGLGNINQLQVTQAAVQVCGELFNATTDDSLTPEEWTPSSPSTTLYWHWDELDEGGPQLGADGSINLSSDPTSYRIKRKFYYMKNVINILVPIQMAFGAFAAALNDKIVNISTIAPTRDGIVRFPEQRFVGTGLVQTSGFKDRKQMKAGDKTCCSVWETRIAQERGLAPRPGILAEPRLIEEGELPEIVTRWKANIQEAMDDFDNFQGWVVDQRSITVSFKPYAWGALALAAVVVLGGLLFGFLIGSRIYPIDPFNVTLFFWGAAVFLIFVLKSFKVAQWDWRDFLLGRIVCRSVSEIVGATGIDDQRFLALLLRMSPVMTLETKGPHHTIFARKSESADGFAIDVALDRETLIKGGYFFVKVDSLLGPALVGLELGKWSPYNCVYAKGSKKDKQGHICRDLDEPWTLRCGGRGPKPVHGVCTNALEWHNTVGVYKEDCYFT